MIKKILLDPKSVETYVLESATTHTIHKEKKYFSHLTISDAHINTISSSSKLIEGSGRAIILLPKGTKFFIDDALFSTKS